MINTFEGVLYELKLNKSNYENNNLEIINHELPKNLVIKKMNDGVLFTTANSGFCKLEYPFSKEFLKEMLSQLNGAFDNFQTKGIE